MITFGICVGSDYLNKEHPHLREIISSIRKTSQGHVEHVEIIAVANKELYVWDQYGDKWKTEVDCDKKPGHITRKKNLITDFSSFDIIVYSHDYFIYGENFYEEVLKADFDIAVPRILNKDGSRYRDKISWGNPAYPPAWVQHEPPWTGDGLYHAGMPRLEPYDRIIPREYWFVNGSFWVAKKSFMQKYRLDERLSWGMAEDCCHSFTWRKDPSIRLEYLLDTYAQSLVQKDLIYKYACH